MDYSALLKLAQRLDHKTGHLWMGKGSLPNIREGAPTWSSSKRLVKLFDSTLKSYFTTNVYIFQAI